MYLLIEKSLIFLKRDRPALFSRLVAAKTKGACGLKLQV